MSGGLRGSKATWEHVYFHVNNLRMHCVVAGSGPTVLLLHGFPEFWYSWRHQIPVLATSYRVIVPDLRGYNQTEKPKGVGQYSMGVLLEDIEGLIQEHTDGKVTLVGHDWGGGLAWTFAAYYPHLVKGLAVLNCPPPPLLAKKILTDPRQRKRSRYIYFFQLPLIPELYIARRDYEFIERLFRGWAVDKSAFTDYDIRRYKEAAAKPGALTAALNYYRASFRRILLAPPSKALSRIPSLRVTCPTLVIWGMEDRAFHPSLLDEIPDYVSGPFQLRTIERCSHWVQQERPDEVNRFLMEFLSDIH
ncbi:MAG: alpha/beta hydrolase [Candidatus Geothermincolales bacterium]